MLEDNFDQRSYPEIASLTQEEIAGVATVIRNPCPNCFEGNDASRNQGSLELHGRETLFLAQSQDSFSLDGTGYHESAADQTPESISTDEVQTLLQQAIDSQFRYFGLWRADRQGLISPEPLEPSRRTYQIPTITQLETERDLLRFQLPEE